MPTETATFAAECFWGVGGALRAVHAEAARVEYASCPATVGAQ